MPQSLLWFPSTDHLCAQSRGSSILNGLSWRSQRGDNEAAFLPFAFPDGAAQPGLTYLSSAGSEACRQWWEADALQAACQRELHAPMERGRHSLGCGHPQLNPSTLAKWKLSALTCKPALVCGVQEAAGDEGAVSNSSS